MANLHQLMVAVGGSALLLLEEEVKLSCSWRTKRSTFEPTVGELLLLLLLRLGLLLFLPLLFAITDGCC